MAWMLINPQIHNIFASLGVRQGEKYKVNDECLRKYQKENKKIIFKKIL